MSPFNTTKEAAEEIARENAEDNTEISEIWLFPDDREVRLIEIDETAMPYPPDANRISAYSFPPYPGTRSPFRFAVAVIRSEDKKRLDPPRGWGTWDDAEKIWSRDRDPRPVRRIQ
jgi:hypothetical protein